MIGMEKIDDLIKRVQFYFREVTVEELMTSPVFTIHQAQATFRAKEAMRLRHFSGIPVVDERNQLVGIISIEDIIHALESGNLNAPISQNMSRDVVTLSKDELIVDVAKKFELHGFGRFPVIDEKKRVIGIVTQHDLITILLSKLSILYVHDARREPFVHVDNYRSIPTGVDLKKEVPEFQFDIDYMDVSLSGIGASKLKKFLRSKGFSPKFVKRVAIATYEAETNVVIHSGSTGIINAYFKYGVLTVRVKDEGKGIEDVDMAMHEGFSTAPDYIREMGFGAGMGLANIKRCSDRMMIISERGKGVLIEMNFWGRENENIRA